MSPRYLENKSLVIVVRVNVENQDNGVHPHGRHPLTPPYVKGYEAFDPLDMEATASFKAKCIPDIEIDNDTDRLHQ
jgi:hypothetical protein